MTISNPILRGFYPDPSVCFVDGVFYLANSTFEYLPGIPIHASRDLVNWELVGHAVADDRDLDYAAADDSRGLFAPTIRFHDGLFYVACTFVAEGPNAGFQNFYVTTENPAGPWSAPVVLADAPGIDPTIFFHEGRAWWAGCRLIEQDYPGQTEIWLRELDLENGRLIGDEVVIWRAALRFGVWSEGPHLYSRDGWFYLVTAEGGTEFHHSGMVARSREITGPYEGSASNPILTHRDRGESAEVQMVGHLDLVEGADGNWWAVALATRPIDGHVVLGRETHVAPVAWERGWPVVNPGVGGLDAPRDRPRDERSTAPQLLDFLTVRGTTAGIAQQEPRGVRLVSTGSGPGVEGRTAFFGRRVTSTDSTVSVTLEEGADAGLILRQSDAFHVRLEREAGRIRLIVRGAPDPLSPSIDTVRADVEVPHGPLDLWARLSPSTVTWGVTAVGRETVIGTSRFDDISSETAGGFVGVVFGPYVFGPPGSSVLVTAWSQSDRR